MVEERTGMSVRAAQYLHSPLQIALEHQELGATGRHWQRSVERGEAVDNLTGNPLVLQGTHGDIGVGYILKVAYRSEAVGIGGPFHKREEVLSLDVATVESSLIASGVDEMVGIILGEIMSSREIFLGTHVEEIMVWSVEHGIDSSRCRHAYGPRRETMVQVSIEGGVN